MPAAQPDRGDHALRRRAGQPLPSLAGDSHRSRHALEAGDAPAGVPASDTAHFCRHGERPIPLRRGSGVGWGTEPYITEFDSLGDVRFDASFDGGAWNYRVFRDTWVARPHHKPSLAVRRGAGGATVYASFNGSTETAWWRVQGGPTPRTLVPLKTVSRTSFETAIPVRGRSKYLSVSALDASKRLLSTSRVIRVSP